MLRPVTAFALVLALAAPAAAQTNGHGGFRELFDREHRLARMYRRDGLARLLDGLSGRASDLAAPPWVLLDQALTRFHHAQLLTPDDVELAYYTATALGEYEAPSPDGGTERRDDEAMAAWRRVRELDPSFYPSHVAFQLAGLHMRRHEFLEARAEYEAALEHAVPPAVRLMDRAYLGVDDEHRLRALFTPVEPVAVHGNLAEAAMLVGDLDDAITHYRAGLELAEDPLTRALALWGLALASDRAGDAEDALRFATRAIQADPLQGDPQYAQLTRLHGAFSVLHFPAVYFEPACEIHAYEALGHEALARADGGTPSAEELRRALVSWRFFLAEGGNASRYAGPARRHVARLESELEAADRPRPRRARDGS